MTMTRRSSRQPLISCQDNPNCDEINGNPIYYADYWDSENQATNDSYRPVYYAGDTTYTPDGQPIVNPGPAELSVFQNEANRLQSHSLGRCRDLGQTIGMNIGAIRMFGKAFWSTHPITGRSGTVAAFSTIPNNGTPWYTAISRRVPDGTTPEGRSRSNDELNRSLRHEFFHKMGEYDWRMSPGAYTAEEWADACA
ncbi:MAG: hypothetical protein Q7S20_11225 [Gemmatimonadaceae bacterium]|nr:hypothetical protein [Gemmatimonadaceae bacterium]